MLTQIHFLAYASRSGSTFLSRQLAEHTADLIVVPEFRSTLSLLALGDSRVRELSSDDLRSILQTDGQLHHALGANGTTLDSIVERSQNRGIHTLVSEILSDYAKQQGNDADRFLLKRGSILDLYDEAERVFPMAKYVHLVRDGRGVASSLLRTEAAYYAGETMGRSDALYAGRVWTQQICQVERLRSRLAERLLEVRYEDLISEEATVCGKVQSFLGCSPAMTKATGTFPIAAPERKLHPLVGQQAAGHRAVAWRHELGRSQGITIEWTQRFHLERCGYSLYWLPKATLSERLLIIGTSRARHLLTSFFWLARRLWQHRRDPRSIWLRGLTRWRRRRSASRG